MSIIGAIYIYRQMVYENRKKKSADCKYRFVKNNDEKYKLFFQLLDAMFGFWNVRT